MTDKKIAKFVGVTPKTLQNWKKPHEQEKDGKTVKFYPPEGKHQLYIGARLATHLLSCKKEEDMFYTELELLQQKADSIVSLLSLVKRDDIEEIVKDSMFRQIEREAKKLKDGLSEIEDTVSLTYFIVSNG